MCLIIVALMLILFYGLSGEIDSLSLSDTIDGQQIVIAKGWEIFSQLWQGVGLVFLAGILAVLLMMKLLTVRGGKKEEL
ncbi:hypothetical protein [Thiomicrorhabdus sp. Milos-T2]|uniref:hypothetical protein n=1 Tax=Thiomicrorhabdus sp. Milos-T2 TaxID=90814 RepID=UPI000494103F|nr:hypothetical protein [Thiomicrorhabdus sp. Milos-T2]